jgi:hypothetical protein
MADPARADKPLCRLTLADTAAGPENTYKIVVKPGCDARALRASGLTTWRLDREQLVLSGRSGSLRFAEAIPRPGAHAADDRSVAAHETVEHDPESGNRFSEKIMLKQKTRP